MRPPPQQTTVARLLIALARVAPLHAAAGALLAGASAAVGFGLPWLGRSVVADPGGAAALALGVAASQGARAVLDLGRDSIGARLGAAAARRLAREVLDRGLRLPLATVESPAFRAFDIATRFYGLRSVGDAAADAICGLPLELAVLAGSLAVAAATSPATGLLLALASAALFVVVRRSERALRAREERWQGDAGRTIRAVVDATIDHRPLLAFGASGWARDRIAALHDIELSSEHDLRAAKARMRSALAGGAALVATAALALSARGLSGGLLAPPDVLLLSAASGLALASAHRIASIPITLQRAALAWARATEVSALDAEAELPRGAEPVDIVGDIELRDVRFEYAPGRPVIDGVSLRIPAGSTVAVIGETGSGKTTLAEVATGLRRPCAGSVLLDGRELAGERLAALRRTLGFVFQRTALLRGTMADNIAFGRAGVPAEAIEEAARLSRAHGFIRELPQGFATPLELGACSLSSGEAQRVGIARALVGAPRVLVLDEATANLDVETERAVLGAIRRGRARRTTIVIAHRLATIRHADRIVVLDRGRIAEQGTHDELTRLGGRYARLLARGAGEHVGEETPQVRQEAAA